MPKSIHCEEQKLMKKRQITIEHELKSNSENIIWRFISTPEGLSKWLADEVTQEGETMTFTWGELWSHHEIRTATLLEVVFHELVKLRWDDDEDPEAYMELKVGKSDVTNEFMLTITDFAEEEDVEAMRDLWEDNLVRLRRTSGL